MNTNSKKIINFMKEHCVWIITLLTFIGAILLTVLKFIEYMKSNLYFSYYGVDMNLYQFEDKNVLYELGLSLFLFIMAGIVFNCIWQIYNKSKNKNKLNRSDWGTISLIIIYDCIFTYACNSLIDNDFNIINFILTFLLIIIIEIPVSNFIFNPVSQTMKVTKEEIINYLKILPLLAIIFFFALSFVLLQPIAARKSYRIIDDKKAIVYTDNDYYLILDCEIVDSQEKISNNNVYSVYKKFEKVEIKEY